MPKRKKLSILDVTIRDGSYAINYQYMPYHVSAVAGALDEAGIDFVEVSHGCGLGAGKNLGFPAAATDAEYVKAAKRASVRAKIGVIAGPEPVTKKGDIDSIIEHVDFIRFAANCDNPTVVEPHIGYVRKLRPDILIFFQMMRSSRIGRRKMLASAKKIEAMGVDLLYIVDTAGHFLPEDVRDIVSTMVENLEVEIGFHGHNNLGLAMANTLAAIDAGASSVDASMRGIGRAGGNAQLEALVSLLHRRKLAPKVNLDRIVAASEEIIAPIMPPSKGISGVDVLTADANIDLYPIAFYERIAKEANLDLKDLFRTLAGYKEMVEPTVELISRALEDLGANPDEVLKRVMPSS